MQAGACWGAAASAFETSEGRHAPRYQASMTCRLKRCVLYDYPFDVTLSPCHVMSCPDLADAWEWEKVWLRHAMPCCDAWCSMDRGILVLLKIQLIQRGHGHASRRVQSACCG